MIKIVATISVFILANVLFLFAVRSIQMSGYRIKECKFDLYDAINRSAQIVAIGGICAILGVVRSDIGFAITTIFALFASLIFYKDYNKLRTKIFFTKRAIRLYVASATLFIGIALVSILTLSDDFYVIVLFLLCLISQILPFIGAVILKPIEDRNNARYINRAKQDIAKLNAIKIGITGSYGKTTCKNILYKLLCEDYKVIKTEKNYNTPMGLALTSKKIVGNEQIFIAEMGARHLGDIATLCDIVKPTIGIITGINSQHLETFYNEYNIYKAKKELIDSLPMGGFAVLNGDCKMAGNMKEGLNINNKSISIQGENDVYATEIKLTNAGSSFKICGLGQPFCVSTHLLGRHNISNILLCATVAHYLGIDTKKLAERISKLQSIPHRLELVPTTNGVTVIDDSYNCNIDGAKFALETIGLFEGRHIVMTQGIVEQGELEMESNKKLGLLISESAELAIVIGKNTNYIMEGLQAGGMDYDNILIFQSLQEAQNNLPKILQSGDVLLIQNDIP